jgi:hypothetical protein
MENVDILHIFSFGIFYHHLVYAVSIYYILPVLVYCTKKNLATFNYQSETPDSSHPVEIRVLDLAIPEASMTIASRNRDAASRTGLPDGIFSNQKSQLGKFGKVLI